MEHLTVNKIKRMPVACIFEGLKSTVIMNFLECQMPKECLHEYSISTHSGKQFCVTTYEQRSSHIAVPNYYPWHAFFGMSTSLPISRIYDCTQSSLFCFSY